MTDTSWVLKGVDPEMRAQAAEEAARLGVSVSDYLADVLLRTALLEQVASLSEAAPADATPIVPESQQAVPDNSFAPRHRIEAVERRLGVAVDTFESAIEGLDTSLVELAARVDAAEAATGETSEALIQVVQEIGANLNALRKRLADSEDTTEALGESHEAAYEMFADRCERLDERLQAIAAAQEALKHAVADDFSELARESADRLANGLSDVRTAADAAAAQADRAVAHLVSELRGLREALEQRVAESAAETRARMQAAFGEAGDRLSGLADRITVTERTTDQLRAQLTDVEDGAQTALEETADTLRQAGAALAGEFARATQDTRIAIESVHADLSNELAEVRERQAGELARIKLIDTAVGNAASEISGIRQLVGGAMADISAVRDGLAEAEASIAAVHENADARFAEADAASRERHIQLHGELNARLAAVAVQEDERQRQADQSFAAFQLETERIEACTLAALEQLNQNISTGATALDAKLDARLAHARREAEALDAKLDARMVSTQRATDALIAEVSERLEGQLAELRDNHSGAVAHLKLIDRTLVGQNVDGAVDAALSPVREQLARLQQEVGARSIDPTIAARLDQLEVAAARTETAQALVILKDQVDVIATQLNALKLDQSMVKRLETLQARVGAVETKSGETADQMQGVARLVGRVSAQSTDAGAQSETRLHKIEVALADLRLDSLKVDTTGPSALAAVTEIAKRMAELEERQAETLKALQSDIAAFIGDSDNRLASIEGRDTGGDPHLAKSFEQLRVSVEERILGIELRSVRTLEQVADTVAMLEERLTGPDVTAEAAQKAG